MNLFEAACQSDLETLSKAIEATTDLEARNRNGWTPLMALVASDQTTAPMVNLLLERGANPNSMTLREKHDSPKSVLAIALRHSAPDKIEALLAGGADASFIDDDGYSILLLACYASHGRSSAERCQIFDLLYGYGACETPPTSHGETVQSVLSNQGYFDLLKLVLDRGADASELDWSQLSHAVALGDEQEVRNALDDGHYLEDRDRWERTPFLIAVKRGHLGIMQLLSDAGSDQSARGRCDTTALHYAVNDNHVEACRWLIAKGGDIHATNEFGHDVLKTAVENDAVDCARALIESGANAFQIGEYGFDLMHDVGSAEMFEFLAEQGLNTASVGSEVRRSLAGWSAPRIEDVSKSSFQEYRLRKFGSRNPQEMNNEFWDAMVRTRMSAWQADQDYANGDSDKPGPTWCFSRFGHSLTRLPDGRLVEIGGEHEDSYDADFCIFNDVVVHDGGGNFTIYGYPESVFPPTDFHSATYVNESIVIIGRLGYHGERQLSSTPVYFLSCKDWSMEMVETTGVGPGWIFKHTATLLDDSQILVHGGKIETESDHVDNDQRWILDLENHVWKLSE